MNIEREPVRLSGYSALVVGLALLAIIGWTQGLDVRAIVGQVAVVALSSISGLEFARAAVTPVAAPRLPDGHEDEAGA
jgi:hypothetical protein